MSIPDQLRQIAEKALELHKEYSTMSANFQNLEKQFDKLVQSNERFMERMSRENEELRRRVTTLEALVNATFAQSSKEAITAVVREYTEKHGKVPEYGFATRSSDQPVQLPASATESTSTKA